MKMTPEIVAALAVLRNAAENDFERHRLDVLERDLTAPPQVEIIDSAHQKFNGVTYRKNSTGHFVYYSSIHRDVYAYFNGEIPEGDFQIHHRDFDQSNNDPTNLEMLTSREHSQIHGSAKRKPPVREKKKSFICECCGKEYLAFDTGQNRFCSKNCLLKYHREHTKETRYCPVCNSPFEVYKNNKKKYCSRECQDKAAQEARQINLSPKKCELCGMEFQPIFSQHKYCSMECSRKARRTKHDHSKYREVRICAWCGKEFETNKHRRTRFCSAHCVVSSNWANRKYENRK